MPNSELIATHYDRLAPEYDTRWTAYVQEEISWVLQHWPTSVKEGLVLDLGCGTGAMLEALARLQPALDLAGTDLSSAMLHQAANRVPQASFGQGNVEDPCFSTTLPHAEVVLSLSILHHLRDIDAHLRLLHALAKPGGVVFLADFSIDGLPMRLAERYFRMRHSIHRQALSHRELKTRLDRYFPPDETQTAVLRPDHFWRIQIYRCSKPLNL